MGDEEEEADVCVTVWKRKGARRGNSYVWESVPYMRHTYGNRFLISHLYGNRAPYMRKRAMQGDSHGNWAPYRRRHTHNWCLITQSQRRKEYLPPPSSFPPLLPPFLPVSSDSCKVTGNLAPYMSRCTCSRQMLPPLSICFPPMVTAVRLTRY